MDSAEPSTRERPARAWQAPASHEREVAAYDELSVALRELLDTFAGSRPDPAAASSAAAAVRAVTDVLRPSQVPDPEQLYGRLPTHGRAHLFTPTFDVDAEGDGWCEGRITFGRFFRGEGGAAHGGAIGVFFDEVLGALANAGAGSAARTAYLHTDYRSVLLVDVEHSFRARVDRSEGRKWFVSATLTRGDVLVAEAQALFVVLRPGQP